MEWMRKRGVCEWLVHTHLVLRGQIMLHCLPTLLSFWTALRPTRESSETIINITVCQPQVISVSLDGTWKMLWKQRETHAHNYFTDMYPKSFQFCLTSNERVKGIVKWNIFASIKFLHLLGKMKACSCIV